MMDPMVDPLRVAVAGGGAIARAVHLPILTRRRDLFAVAAVCDVSEAALDRVGRRFGVAVDRRFSDVDRMLDGGDIDALLVATSGSHTPPVLAGLRRGLPVLCEKPLALTRREAGQIAAAVGGRGDRLLLGYMKTYDPAVRAAVRVDRPAAPRAVDVTVLHPSTAAQLETSELDHEPAATTPGAPSDTSELEREALGPASAELGPLYSGVLLGSLVHELAVLRVLGVDLDAIDHVERWPAGADPPSISVLARTSGGTRVALRWHYLPDHPRYHEEIRVHDEHGSLELVFPSPYLLRAPTTLRVVRADGRGVREHRFTSPVEAFEEQLVAFHAMVTAGAPPVAGVAEGLADIVTCQRICARLAEHEGLAIGGEAAGIVGR